MRIQMLERLFLIGRGYSVIVPSLYSDLEEADTQLLLHAKHAANTYQRIIIQSPDTNLEDFCIAHFLSVKYEEPWLKTRVKDGARFIPIHSLQSALVLSIPGLYQPTMHWQDVTQKVHFLVLVRRKLGRSSSKIVKLNNNNLLAWVRSHFSHNLSKSRVKHLFINSTPRLDVRK